MNLDDRIRSRERRLFAELHVPVHERFLRLGSPRRTVRVLEAGAGPPLLLLHGVTQSAAVWTPLFLHLPGYRLLGVDLPGHGLSDPMDFRAGEVRGRAVRLLDRLLDALGLEQVPVLAHSLGAMFALWRMVGDEPRISSLVAVGDPAVALAGARVRMPLSLLGVRGLGPALLQAPSPRWAYRGQLARGLGGADAGGVPDPLLDVLRLSGRRPGNARTVGSLMRALNRLGAPRPENVLSDAELASIATPTAFIWGSDDPYLSPALARPSIARMPDAVLHELSAGHAPWLREPAKTSALIRSHLQAGSPAPP